MYNSLNNYQFNTETKPQTRSVYLSVLNQQQLLTQWAVNANEVTFMQSKIYAFI